MVFNPTLPAEQEKTIEPALSLLTSDLSGLSALWPVNLPAYCQRGFSLLCVQESQTAEARLFLLPFFR